MYVSKKGRQRVLKEQKKSVHAWVEGNWNEENNDEILIDTYKEAYYNPYINESFIDKKEGFKLETCNFVFLKNKNVYYKKED